MMTTALQGRPCAPSGLLFQVDLQDLESPEHFRQTEVLGEPAVEEGDVGTRWILVGLERSGAQQGTARRPGLGAGGLGGGLPRRRLPAAGPAAVLQGDGREQGRQRGRSGHGPSQRDPGKVGADGVELVLGVAEAGAGGDVGAVDDHEGAVGTLQVAEGRAAGDRLVVELGEEIRRAEGP